jgi:hypothetical protein
MLQIFFPRGTWSRARSAPWNDTSPVREELFGVERLERHAETLAAAQQVTTRPPPVISLQARLSDNAAALLSAYRICASDLESGRGVVPAAEWLLDNYHLVEEQIREIRADLPPRLLPAAAQTGLRSVCWISTRIRAGLGFCRPHRQSHRPRYISPVYCSLSAGSAAYHR